MLETGESIIKPVDLKEGGSGCGNLRRFALSFWPLGTEWGFIVGGVALSKETGGRGDKRAIHYKTLSVGQLI